MTIQTQLGGFAISGGDLPFKNYTVTDIPDKTAVILDQTSGNIMGVKPPATSGAVTESIGITMEKIAAGKTGRVRCLGAAVAVSSGTVTAGNPVQIDSTSGNEGKVKAQGAGVTQLGRALTTAAANDPVLVLLGVATNA